MEIGQARVTPGRDIVMARSLSFVNNKMAGKRSLLALKSLFLSLASLAAVFRTMAYYYQC